MNKPILNSDIIYPELSYSIIGAAMDVHNGLGPGWDEWDYHRSLLDALGERGHVVVSHGRKGLVHRDVTVDHFEFDILVDDLVVLELKHIKTAFHPEHLVQIINYLKCWEKKLGILINFGLERLAYKRIPYDPVSGSSSVSGKWTELMTRIPMLCNRVRNGVEGVLSACGYGYGINIFQKLLITELRFLGSEATQLIASPLYGKRVLEERTVDCVSVDSKLLVSIAATGQNASSSDLAYLKSYMRKTDIPFGILVDIGSSGIQLKGVM